MGTVALLSFTFGGTDGLFTGDAIFHILSGGLILGAFYMATDMVTTPVTFRGRLLFGFGCGLITFVIGLIRYNKKRRVLDKIMTVKSSPKKQPATGKDNG